MRPKPYLHELVQQKKNLLQNNHHSVVCGLKFQVTSSFCHCSGVVLKTESSQPCDPRSRRRHHVSHHVRGHGECEVDNACAIRCCNDLKWSYRWLQHTYGREQWTTQHALVIPYHHCISFSLTQHKQNFFFLMNPTVFSCHLLALPLQRLKANWYYSIYMVDSLTMAHSIRIGTSHSIAASRNRRVQVAVAIWEKRTS